MKKEEAKATLTQKYQVGDKERNSQAFFPDKVQRYLLFSFLSFFFVPRLDLSSREREEKEREAKKPEQPEQKEEEEEEEGKKIFEEDFP